MDAPARRRFHVPLHRVFRSEESRPAPPAARTLLGQTLWIALAGTWLELLVLGLHEILVGNVTHGTHRFHRYHVPLNFASSLAILAPGSC